MNSNLKDTAKAMLSQMYLERSAALAVAQVKSDNPIPVLMYASELSQVENVTRVLQSVYDEGRNAGISAAIRPIIREADARMKPSPAKTVLEALCKEVRGLHEGAA